jgi:DNA-binding Lrp family transcriptional regulator
MKTIRQIANEIGVSKQAVHQRIRREPLLSSIKPFTSTVNGMVYINEQGETLIKQAFNKIQSTNVYAVDVNKPSTVDSKIVDILKEQLTEKDRQIGELNARLREQTAANKELTSALENTTASLYAAQTLHAGTMQQQLTDTSNSSPINAESPTKRRFRDLFKKNR